jgi:hypothetical protein
LNFYFSMLLSRPSIILDRPNCFRRLEIILIGSKLFWLGPNHFDQVQIRLFWTIFYNLDLSKMIWTQLKQIVSVQNDLGGPKSFLTPRRTRDESHVFHFFRWFNYSHLFIQTLESSKLQILKMRIIKSIWLEVTSKGNQGKKLCFIPHWSQWLKL